MIVRHDPPCADTECMPCWWDAVDRETYSPKKRKGVEVTEPTEYENNKTWHLPFNSGHVTARWTWAGESPFSKLTAFLKRLKK